jgi:hypothetical protein
VLAYSPPRGRVSCPIHQAKIDVGMRAVVGIRHIRHGFGFLTRRPFKRKLQKHHESRGRTMMARTLAST